MSFFASQLVVGQYVPGTSPIHRANPFVKLLLILVVMAGLMISRDGPGYASIGALWLAGHLASGLSLRFFWLGIRPILWLVALTVALHVAFTPGQGLAASGPLSLLTREGVAGGLTFAARLLLLVSFTSLLTLTTSTVELTKAIERLTRPLGLLGFPSAEFALMLTIALRFIPVLFMEMDRIMKAQRCRGVSFGGRDLVKLAGAYTSILVPLFVSTFNRAMDLALAMEARGYQTGRPRGSYRTSRISGIDGVVCLVVALALVPALARR